MTSEEIEEMANNLTKAKNEEELSEVLVKSVAALDPNCSEKEIKDALKSDDLSDLFKALNL